MRCAFCHGVGVDAPACGTCGTLLHAECWSALGGCSTLGCAASAVRCGPQATVVLTPPSRLAHGYPWSWLAGFSHVAFLGLYSFLAAGYVRLIECPVGFGFFDATHDIGPWCWSTHEEAFGDAPATYSAPSPLSVAAILLVLELLRAAVVVARRENVWPGAGPAQELRLSREASDPSREAR